MKQMGWQAVEIDTIGIHFQKSREFLSSEAAAQINNRSYSNNLDCWTQSEQPNTCLSDQY
jgi:hypothetical protein